MHIVYKWDSKDRWPGLGATRPIWWPVMVAGVRGCAGQRRPGGCFTGARVTGWHLIQEGHLITRE